MYGIGYRLARVLGGYFSDLANAFKSRVLGDGGTYESGCLTARLGTIGEGIIEQASLITTPNAYKASTIYSVVPSSGAGDLDFTRASTATRVNASGLIEEVASGVPRMDYTNGCPQILLEPQSTNLITYSEDFSDASWGTIGCTKTSISDNNPIDNSAFEIESTLNGASRIYINSILSFPKTYSSTIMVKPSANSPSYIGLALVSNTQCDVYYDMVNNIFVDASTVGNAAKCKSTSMTNGWYLLEMPIFNNIAATRYNIYQGEIGASYTLVGVLGESYYIKAAQLEESDHATSYIPTSGTTATRILDTSETSGLSSVIGQSEGVFFVDFEKEYEDIGNRSISISADNSNRLTIITKNNELRVFMISGGAWQVYSSVYTDLPLGRCKIAFRYKLNDCEVFVNGVSVFTDTSATMPSGSMDYLFFGNVLPSTNYFHHRINNILLSDAFLNDTELTDLTKQAVAHYLDPFIARVTAAAATIEDDCLEEQLTELTTPLIEQASLLQIPSAYDTNVLYGVKGNDLTFTRASTATRVNEDGLIESVASGVPRIDYTNGDCGQLLLEPQRTNLVTYSEDFSDASWTKTGISVSSNTTTSPNGTATADSWIEDAGGNAHVLRVTRSVTATTDYTFSVFAKSNGNNWIGLFTDSYGLLFNLSDGTIGGNIGSQPTYTIETLLDDWYRVSITVTQSTTAGVAFDIYSSKNGVDWDYSGDGTSGIYLWGAMIEEGSHSTSYIPTAGATATRVGETSVTTGLSSVINSEEGVLYWEASALSNNIGSPRLLSISDGSAQNTLYTGYSSSSNSVQSQLIVGGVSQTNMLHTVSNVTNIIKVAILYQNNNHKMYVNGVQVSSDTSGSVPSANIFDRLSLDLGQGSFPFYGNINSFKVFPTALTDTELITLTTDGAWSTYNEMAEFYGYNIL